MSGILFSSTVEEKPKPSLKLACPYCQRPGSLWLHPAVPPADDMMACGAADCDFHEPYEVFFMRPEVQAAMEKSKPSLELSSLYRCEKCKHMWLAVYPRSDFGARCPECNHWTAMSAGRVGEATDYHAAKDES